MKITRLPKEAGLAGIWQTMYIMRDVVYSSVRDRDIKDYTVSLLKKYNIEPNDEVGQIKTIFSHIRNKVKYSKDIEGIEEIQTPNRMIRELKTKGWAYGDCDDMAILIASMLYNIGFKTRFVVVATRPKIYNHIRTEVMQNEIWIPLELTSRKPVGYGFRSYEKPLILEI